jgi:hypothetical protein
MNSKEHADRINSGRNEKAACNMSIKHRKTSNTVEELCSVTFVTGIRIVKVKGENKIYL